MKTRILVFAATLLVCLPLLAAQTVAGLIETYDHPTLGPSVAVNNVTFESGHMKITLAQGHAALVKAGDETLGIFFKGTGKFDYLSPDATEAAVMTTNVKKGTALGVQKTDKGLAVGDSFNDVFIRVAAHALPDLGNAAGGDLKAAWAEHVDTFDRELQAPVFSFVKQKIDAPKSPLVRAQFRGGKELLVYQYDTVVSKNETLYSLHAIRQSEVRELKGALFPIELSSLPIGRTRKEFVDPDYLLFDLTYSLTANGNDASLSVVETIIPRRNAQSVFRFNQHDVIYDPPRGTRKYNVRSVKTESGQDLQFVHRDRELLVGLPAAVQPEVPFKLKFEIDGDFLIRPSGDSYWELGTEPWFPQPDLNGQYYTIHSKVKVKKPFVPFAPGETVSRREEGEYNVVENKIEKPVQFAIVLAGKYSYEEETQDGLTIRVASYAGKNTRAMKQLTNLAFKIIKYYEPFLGPFPFKEFNIIEINEFGYGQAPPATMFITKEAFNPMMGETNQIFSKGINHRFAHEIAHQYWGHVVKMGSVEEQWVTESFSEYCSSFIVRQIKGQSGFDSMVSTWKANANDAKNASSIATANRLRDYSDGFTSFMTRTHLVYDKGAYVLAQLHKQIGDQAFLTFLRTMQGVFAWRFATTSDMVAVLQKITGKDFGPFFEQNFWGTGMP